MARPLTGSIRERMTSRGVSFALRLPWQGGSYHLSLGTEADGYTREKAERERERIVSELKAGTWTPPATDDALSLEAKDLIRQEIATGRLLDADAIAAAVMESASPMLRAEQEFRVWRNLVLEVVRANRSATLTGERLNQDDIVRLPSGELKTWGTCTIADVDALREDCERRRDDHMKAAEQEDAEAIWLERLVEKMRRCGAATVADLDDSGESLARAA